jgi:hypothetical protein
MPGGDAGDVCSVVAVTRNIAWRGRTRCDRILSARTDVAYTRGWKTAREASLFDDFADSGIVRLLKKRMSPVDSGIKYCDDLAGAVIRNTRKPATPDLVCFDDRSTLNKKWTVENVFENLGYDTRKKFENFERFACCLESDERKVLEFAMYPVWNIE